MQDNRIHIDEKFTNHAWGEMSKLLDKELPVQGRPRRRVAWWMFAMLALGLAGTIVWVWSKKLPATAATPTKPVAEGKFDAATTQNSAVGTVTAFKENDLEVKDAQLNQSVSNVAHKHQAPTTGSSPTHKAEVMNKVFDKQPIPPPSDPEAADFYMQASSSTTSLSNIEGKSISEVHKSETPTQLEFAELRFLSAKSNQQPSAAALPIDPFANNWKLGFQTDALAAISNEAAGFSVKFLTAKSLKNSKLSFETGIGYVYMQQPLQVVVNQYPIGINSVAESEVVYGTDQLSDSKGGFSSQANVRTNYSEGLNLHYVVLPAQVSYRLTNRFSVHAGFDAGVLLASSSDITGSGFFKRSVELTTPSLEAEERSGINVSLIDMAATGGVRYRLSAAFSIQAGYRLGVKDILPSNAANDFNRFVQLGIRYDLSCNR